MHCKVQIYYIFVHLRFVGRHKDIIKHIIHV